MKSKKRQSNKERRRLSRTDDIGAALRFTQVAVEDLNTAFHYTENNSEVKGYPWLRAAERSLFDAIEKIQKYKVSVWTDEDA